MSGEALRFVLLKVCKQLACRLITFIHVGVHCLEAYALKLLGDIGNQLAGADRIGVHMLYGDLNIGSADIRQLAGEHFVHDDAERVYIASRIGSLTARLLGRNVVHRADGLTVIFLDIAFERGNAEVCDLYHAVLEKHDILRLYIAVDDALAVRMLQSFCNLNGEIQNLGRLENAFFLQILLERYAFNELHDDIFDIVAVAYVIHRNDIRMRKHRDGLRLGTKTTAKLGVRGSFVAHYLDRVISVKSVAQSLVHIRHAARAYELDDLIAVIKDPAYIFISTVFHNSTFNIKS